jgi:hypothetical protein
MPTDVATFRARLLDERAAVVAEIAAIDLVDEQARHTTAKTNLENSPAMVAFRKADRRWSLVQEKIARLDVLDEQIAVFNP